METTPQDNSDLEKEALAGKWRIPACFDVLTDISDKESKEFDTVISEPIRLARLPNWCDVYRGLSDKEVEAVEESILARSPTASRF